MCSSSGLFKGMGKSDLSLALCPYVRLALIPGFYWHHFWPQPEPPALKSNLLSCAFMPTFIILASLRLRDLLYRSINKSTFVYIKGRFGGVQ